MAKPNRIDRYLRDSFFDRLPALVADRQLMAYRHTSFWRCMDTTNEQRLLDAMWHEDSAPWKVWAA